MEIMHNKLPNFAKQAAPRERLQRASWQGVMCIKP